MSIPITTITNITMTKSIRGVPCGNRIDSAARAPLKRQNIPGEGIFYLRYSVPCTEEIDYPFQFELVEMSTNFGIPTALAESSSALFTVVAGLVRWKPAIVKGHALHGCIVGSYL